MTKGLRRAALCWGLWIAAGSQALAQVQPVPLPKGPPPVEAAAASALLEATRLADLMDVDRGSWPRATLAEALARARESEPKPALGMGSWRAAARGVKAEVSSPRLCREIQNQCSSLPAEAPGACSCLPTRGGLFELSFELGSPAP